MQGPKFDSQHPGIKARHRGTEFYLSTGEEENSSEDLLDMGPRLLGELWFKVRSKSKASDSWATTPEIILRIREIQLFL